MYDKFLLWDWQMQLKPVWSVLQRVVGRNYSASNCALSSLSPLIFTNPHVLSLLQSVKHFFSAACLWNTKLMLKEIQYIDKTMVSSVCENGHTAQAQLDRRYMKLACQIHSSSSADDISPTGNILALLISDSCGERLHFDGTMFSYWHTPTHPQSSLCGDWCYTLPSSQSSA